VNLPIAVNQKIYKISSCNQPKKIYKMNQFSLEGKVIVVTGGTGILGASFIDAIVEAGGAVGILGRKKVLPLKEPMPLISKVARPLRLLQT
jgi:hypothetical protein